MIKLIRGSLIAVALMGTSLAIAVPASADVVGVHVGGLGWASRSEMATIMTVITTASPTAIRPTGAPITIPKAGIAAIRIGMTRPTTTITATKTL